MDRITITTFEQFSSLPNDDQRDMIKILTAVVIARGAKDVSEVIPGITVLQGGEDVNSFVKATTVK